MLWQVQKGLIAGRAALDAAAGGGGLFSLAWLTSATDSSSTNPVTYAGLSFGAADTDRIIAVYIASRQTTVNTITGVTIGGVSATAVTGTAAQVNGTNGACCQIWQAAVPTGTSGNVVVTYGAAPTRSVVSLYRIITVTPTATSGNSDSQTTLTSVGTAVTVPSGGGAIAGAAEQANTNTFTWSNATQDVQGAIAGSQQYTTATVTGTGSITPNANDGAIVPMVFSTAAWGP